MGVKIAGLAWVCMLILCRLVWAAPDSYEPDNNFGQASTMVIGQTQANHSLDPIGDVDWFRFEVPTVPRGLEMQTDGATGDTILQLYDHTGTNSLGWDDDSGNGWFSKITYTFTQAGTYYLRVQEYGNDGIINNYSVSILPPGTPTAIRTATAIPTRTPVVPATPTITPTLPPHLVVPVGSMKVFNNWIHKNLAGYGRRTTWCVIRWSQPDDGAASLTIYDMNGRVVRTLLDGQWRAAKVNHEIAWDGCDSRAEPVGTGFYIAYLRCGQFEARCKIAVTP